MRFPRGSLSLCPYCQSACEGAPSFPYAAASLRFAELLYVIPLADALDEHGGLNTGVPAMFVVAEDSLGRQSEKIERGAAEPRGAPGIAALAGDACREL